MGRSPCCDKANVKRGPWSPEEDRALKSYVEKNGTGGNWIALPQKAGLRRCGKSCRLRWLNYLRPDIKHGGFTEEEDRIICSLYKSLGSRWSVIANQLPGRTDNDVKNYWNTKLKKKLLSAQPSTTTTSKPTPPSPPPPPPPPPPPLPTAGPIKTKAFPFSTTTYDPPTIQTDSTTFPLMAQEYPTFHLPYADPYASLWSSTYAVSPPPPPEDLSAASTSLTTDNSSTSSSSSSSNGLWMEGEGLLVGMGQLAASTDAFDWSLKSWVGAFDTQDPTFSTAWPGLDCCNNSQDLYLQSIIYS